MYVWLFHRSYLTIVMSSIPYRIVFLDCIDILIFSAQHILIYSTYSCFSWVPGWYPRVTRVCRGQWLDGGRERDSDRWARVSQDAQSISTAAIPSTLPIWAWPECGLSSTHNGATRTARSTIPGLWYQSTYKLNRGRKGQHTKIAITNVHSNVW